MHRIYGAAITIALLGLVWNVIALVAHLLFGVHLPVVDPGSY